MNGKERHCDYDIRQEALEDENVVQALQDAAVKTPPRRSSGIDNVYLYFRGLDSANANSGRSVFYNVYFLMHNMM